MPAETLRPGAELWWPLAAYGKGGGLLDLGSKHQVRAVDQADPQGAERGSEHLRVCLPHSVQARRGASDATEY